jgi:prevent-host-death family protein
MRKVSTHEAKTHLSRLIAEVQAGEEIIICRGDQPAARLVPLSGERPERRRPSVGTRTSPPVEYATGAFEPLSDSELESWGV